MVSWNFLLFRMDFIGTMRGLAFGTSIPIVPLPGIGAMMRIPSEARSSWKESMSRRDAISLRMALTILKLVMGRDGGIIVMCVICVLPILKIGVIQLMLKLTSSIAEPLTDKRVSSMLWEVSESVTTIFAVVVMVAVLFMINISIMLATTGIGG